MATVATGEMGRRMSAGRVFDRAFSTIRHNPAVTLGLALLFGALPGSLSSYMVSMAGADAFTSAAGAAGFTALMIVSIVIGFAIAALVQGVLTRATVAESEGRKAGFGECIGAAFAVFLPLIGLSLALAFAVGLGFILLIVPGVMLYLAWCVAAPALVEEREGVFAAFGRSNELTKGARWKILGIMLVLLVAYYLASAVIGLIAFATLGISDDPATAANMPFGFLFLSIVLGTIVNVFWGAVQASLFVELRDWKDGPAVENLEEVFG